MGINSGDTWYDDPIGGKIYYAETAPKSYYDSNLKKASVRCKDNRKVLAGEFDGWCYGWCDWLNVGEEVDHNHCANDKYKDGDIRANDCSSDPQLEEFRFRKHCKYFKVRSHDPPREERLTYKLMSGDL